MVRPGLALSFLLAALLPPALAALPARSRTIDLRGNVTHTENLGSVPKVPILKYRIILRGQANIMQIARAAAGSVPKFLIGARGREHIQR